MQESKKANYPKYPSAVVRVGPKDTALTVMVAVRKAMREAGASDDDMRWFAAVATIGKFDVLLAASEQMVTIERQTHES